jgi:hypothetical protein
VQNASAAWALLSGTYWQDQGQKFDDMMYFVTNDWMQIFGAPSKDSIFQHAIDIEQGDGAAVNQWMGIQAFNAAFVVGTMGYGAVEGAAAKAANRSAAAGSLNLMGGEDQFFKNVANRADINPNGFFDVIAHGNSQRIELLTANGSVAIDQRTAARLIENSSGYTSGQPIRLLSCDTGACDAGFAQNLANKMGVTVSAPTELVWAYPDGKIVVAPRTSLDPVSPYYNVPDLSRQGVFKIFLPGGNK